MKKIICLVMMIVMVFCMVTVNVFAKDNDVSNDAAIDNAEIQAETRRLVYNAAWFRTLRTTYNGYQAHYTTNSQMESGMGYIYGQKTCPDFYIGKARMSDVGCEIAAVYNALKKRGLVMPCASIIRTFEKEGYLMTVGYLGSDPYAIKEYFASQIAYQPTQYNDYTSFKNYVDSNKSSLNVYIVSFWNDDSITNGLHTVAFYTQNGKFYAYNKYGSHTTITTYLTLEEISKGEKYFIVGYFVPRMGRMIDLESVK